MDINRIDFISSYCDRWCERCAFDRCSAFACDIALTIPSVTYVTNGYFATDVPGGL